MRIVPSVQLATTRDWPTATWVVDSTAPARPTPKADTAGAPSWRVRCPPTRGTAYSVLAACMPRSASRARVSLPTTVSTMPQGVAPMATRSLTLVSTAANPAP